MADVVNRSNPTIWLKSVNTPDYSPDEWLVNPDLVSAGLVDANGNILVANKHWKVVGDSVQEMSQQEKDALPGDAIREEDIKYKIYERENSRVSTIRHYKYEINSASGFSGFSGLGKQTFYNYQGARYLGFSECMFDTKGNVIGIETTDLSTGPDGEVITRVK
jgi:hypothetical protein